MQQIILKYLIFSLFATTLPSGSVVSVFEIGNLVEHFQQHQNEANGYDFGQFLAEHYSENQHKESDAAHEKLPFHHHHQSDCCHFVAQTAVVLPPVFVNFIFERCAPAVSGKIVAHPHQAHSVHCAGKIWQPPKG
jgi:hypothetical protein